MKINIRLVISKKCLLFCLLVVSDVNLCTGNIHNSNNIQQLKVHQNQNNRLNHHHTNLHQQYHQNSNKTTDYNSTDPSTLAKSIHNIESSNNKTKFSNTPTNVLQRIIDPNAKNGQYYNSNRQSSYSGGQRFNTGSVRDYRPAVNPRNGIVQPSERSMPFTGKHGISRDVETFRNDNVWQIQRNSDSTPGPEYHNRNNEDIRHICMQQKIIQIPVKTTEVYSRPIYRKITEPCHSNNLCTRLHIFHEPRYRDVITHKQSQQISYDCCQGWAKLSKDSTDCLKPICRMTCKNGGTCSKPDICSCPPGFTGRFCETDINECKENKPCDQFCYNTDGSYYCKCKQGFTLHTDMQSCRKISTDDHDIAFEARDLENEIDDGSDVSARVHHLEKILENERVKTHEMEKSLQSTYYTVNSLKSRLSTLEHMQQPLQESLIVYGTKTKKLENLINLLINCRKNPNSIYCPS